MRIKRITAIITMLVLVVSAFAACGKEPAPAAQGVKSVTVTRTEFAPSDYIETFSRDPQRYAEKLAASFEMDSATKDSFFSAPEEWLAYSITLNVVNSTDNMVTLFGIGVEDNGRGGVYIQTQLEDGITLSKGSSGSVSITVLCSNGELADSEVKALADAFTLNTQYYVGEAMGEVPAETFTAAVAAASTEVK